MPTLTESLETHFKALSSIKGFDTPTETVDAYVKSVEDIVEQHELAAFLYLTCGSLLYDSTFCNLFQIELELHNIKRGSLKSREEHQKAVEIFFSLLASITQGNKVVLNTL